MKNPIIETTRLVKSITLFSHLEYGLEDGLEEEVRGCVDNNNEGDEGEGDLNGNVFLIFRLIPSENRVRFVSLDFETSMKHS